jgi:2,4'-dihydroxyacetophenone dioxygenase
MTTAAFDEVARHTGANDLPGVDATGGIWLMVLRVDAASGIRVVRNRFEPGVRLQAHRHTGPVDGYTISGRWHYLEYDFYNAAGSHIREARRDRQRDFSTVHEIPPPAI